MRLSTKSRYGLRAIFDIAYNSKGKPTQVKDISRRQEIPPRYLEQIFRNLTRARIVGSKRGPNGGYFLLKHRDEITIKDIINAADGAIEVVPCTTNASPLSRCHRSEHCAARTIWREAQEILSKFLGSMTIADLCTKAEALGVEKENNGKLDLSI
ncbi:MAG: RrF2 family transcriptional regulator [Deltaproteobacteria bacterium]|nr:RrF2 family transcriptional regulator [Deltaproteobacteria bacterium]MBW2307603.1 RrF2 family transcriptional regulator [Deltaproteobacteria bacterium]